MDKRIPIAVLVILFVVALIWRLINPPPPTPPGPLGDTSSWRSSARVGEMTAQAVNPEGTCWAGGWFKKTERSQQASYRSALRIMPFDSKDTRTVLFSPPKDNGYLAGVTWMDDSTIAVLLNDNDSASPTASSLAIVDAVTGAMKSEAKLTTPVYRLLGLIGKTGQIACLVRGPQKTQLSSLTADGRLDIRKPTLLFKESDAVGPVFGASPSGRYMVASIDTDLPQGRTPIYYLLESDTGNARPIFNYLDLPSRVERVFVSDTGEVLVVCRIGDKPEVFSVKTGPDRASKPSPKPADVRRRWPDCPKEFLFVSVKYIYSYDPATNKHTVLVELKGDGPDRENVVQQVKEGNAYRLGADRFVTVSTVTNTADIRIFSKTGTMEMAILPRQ